jgi:hypothetical protein
MRINKNEERSSENLTIRIKPSIKAKLKIISDYNEMGMAQSIERLIENEYENKKLLFNDLLN